MTTLYTRSAYAPALAFVCGSRSSSYLQLFDRSSWESFGEDELARYVSSGAQLLARRIYALGSVTRPVSARERRELLFMLESLLHARTLLAQKD